MSPKYIGVSSVVSSASCSNNFTTSTTNLLLANIPTTANNIPHARISDGSLALTQTLVSEPIYTFSSLSSTSHSSSFNTGVETWAQNLTTPNLHPSSQTFNFSAPHSGHQLGRVIIGTQLTLTPFYLEGAQLQINVSANTNINKPYSNRISFTNILE